MPLSIADLVAHAELGLVELHRGGTSNREISWVSSSDLPDPTPFLVPDQLLLTTGLQFGERPSGDRVRRYVANLRDHGVLGIGFGTEVLRAGTPPGLVTACRESDIALVEIPYRTPFLAIIRLVAHELERAARERERWALASIRAISAAAISRGDSEVVVRELASRLAAEVRRFDADGQLVERSPRARVAVEPEIAAEVRRLLAAGDRAASELVLDGVVTSFQTIGPTGGLVGVLMVTGVPSDRAARSVSTSAVALLEVAETASRRTIRTRLAVHDAAYRLIQEGRSDLAESVSRGAGMALPAMPGVAVVLESASAEALQSLAEREARREGRLVLVSPSRLAVVVAAGETEAVAHRIAEWGQAVGVARVPVLDELPTGIVRAVAACRRAAAGSVIAWEAIPPPASVDDATQLAAGLIAPIAASSDGRLEIEAATAWFDENCNWGAAARQLGLHPHTVRDRVASLASRLTLGIDTFEQRARLWAALTAVATEPGRPGN